MGRQVTNGYDNIVLTLAKADKWIDIPDWMIENQLTEHLGIIRQRTAIMHMGIMVKLGYLRLTKKGFPGQRTYDLIGEKVLQLKSREMSRIMEHVKGKQGVL